MTAYKSKRIRYDVSMTNVGAYPHGLSAHSLRMTRTVKELQALLSEQGESYIRTRMFGIGKVTADEILRFLVSA